MTGDGDGLVHVRDAIAALRERYAAGLTGAVVVDVDAPYGGGDPVLADDIARDVGQRWEQ